METLLNAHVFRALICPVHEISRELAFSEAVKVPISESKCGFPLPAEPVGLFVSFQPN